MTAPHLSETELLALASELGCVGVEFRNDLPHGFFTDHAALRLSQTAKSMNLRILALAEVKAFNDPEIDVQSAALSLIKTAQACGAEGVALIPKVAQTHLSRTKQREALLHSLIKLQPLLEDHGVVGLIEPLGFVQSTLRFKDDVAAVLEALNRPACFRIIHDTFHHHLAQTDTLHPDLTGLVHISGVRDPEPDTQAMTDADRVLVDSDDRLGNLAQLKALRRDGYTGPASFEAFAPEIHNMTTPKAALSGSIAFIADQMAGEPA